MAIALEAASVFAPAAWVGNSDHTFDSGGGSDRFLVVGGGFRDSGVPDLTGVSYNGTSLTAFGAKVSGGTQGGAHGYHMTNPAAGSNQLRLINGTGTNLTAAVLAACYSGVDQTTPFDGYTTAGGSDTTADLTITSQVGDTVFFFAGGFISTYTSSAPTNYTERGDQGNGAAFGTGGDGAGAASVACTATITASSVFGWAGFGCNMNPAGGGGGGGGSPLHRSRLVYSRLLGRLA